MKREVKKYISSQTARFLAATPYVVTIQQFSGKLSSLLFVMFFTIGGYNEHTFYPHLSLNYRQIIEKYPGGKKFPWFLNS